jgi:predicted nucleotidyltransferase
MPVDSGEISELLTTLIDAGVAFVLVGGGAAVIHGAPITTQDVDIVHDRSPQNVRRLLLALAAVDARIADPAGRDLRPSAPALEGPGQSLLRTRLGRLDVLGALHDGRGYDDLVATAEAIDLDGRELRVVDLDTLIQIKSSTGRAKDRLVVPILLAIAKARDTRTTDDD